MSEQFESAPDATPGAAPAPEVEREARPRTFRRQIDCTARRTTRGATSDRRAPTDHPADAFEDLRA